MLVRVWACGVSATDTRSFPHLLDSCTDVCSRLIQLYCGAHGHALRLYVCGAWLQSFIASH